MVGGGRRGLLGCVDGRCSTYIIGRKEALSRRVRESWSSNLAALRWPFFFWRLRNMYPEVAQLLLSATCKNSYESESELSFTSR
jgi:hypothetical protein